MDSLTQIDCEARISEREESTTGRGPTVAIIRKRMNPQQLREGAYEGSPRPGPKSELHNKSLHLIYQTHIDKQKYREWFRTELAPAYCEKECEVEFLEIAHEGPDMTNRENHTHVVVTAASPIRTRKEDIFDWSPSEDGDTSKKLRPVVLRLKRADELESAKHMLGDEDPEYIDYRWKYVKYKKRAPVSRKDEAVFDDNNNVRSCLAPTKDPRCKLPHLVRWQRQAYDLMEYSTPGILNYIYDDTTSSGKMSFVTALRYTYPTRYHILIGQTDIAYIHRVYLTRRSLWNRAVLILNTMATDHTRRIPSRVIDALMNAAVESGCMSVWILSNSLPSNLDTMDPNKLNIYRISSVPSSKTLSDLDRISYDEALLTLQRQRL